MCRNYMNVKYLFFLIKIKKNCIKRSFKINILRYFNLKFIKHDLLKKKKNTNR